MKFTSEHQPVTRNGRGKSERNKILDAMAAEGTSEEEFYQLLVRRALDKEDSFGAPELFKRMAPIPKSTMPLVEFNFDDGAPPAVQAAQVMKAASEGLLAPDVANMFISSISSMLKIDEVTELQKRLEAIEESLGVNNG